ncbi:4773_t:CDS:2 [Entrophospora sp. SA101]|nr:4773_t:CDS:2 [Entrophospora sp. SA101]
MKLQIKEDNGPTVRDFYDLKKVKTTIMTYDDEKKEYYYYLYIILGSD